MAKIYTTFSLSFSLSVIWNSFKSRLQTLAITKFGLKTKKQKMKTTASKIIKRNTTTLYQKMPSVLPVFLDFFGRSCCRLPGYRKRKNRVGLRGFILKEGGLTSCPPLPEQVRKSHTFLQKTSSRHRMTRLKRQMSQHSEIFFFFFFFFFIIWLSVLMVALLCFARFRRLVRTEMFYL